MAGSLSSSQRNIARIPLIVPQVAICGEGSALSPWVMVATELAQLELPFIFNKSEAHILLDKHEQKFYRK